jgi:serine/threonine protein kinase
MQPGFNQFTIDYADFLQKNPLRIPLVVADELNRLANQPDTTKSEAARNAIVVIKSLTRGLMAEFRGEPGDVYVDLVIQRVVEQHLLRYDIAVLTNDVSLMKDLHAKLYKHSVQTCRSIVAIKLHGRWQTPRIFEPTGDRNQSNDPNDPKTRHQREPKFYRGGPSLKPFEAVGRTAKGLEKTLDASVHIDEGVRIFLSDGSPIKLGPKIHEGGEGAIFEIQGWDDGVCKIYFKKALSAGKRDKIIKMLTRKVDHPSIYWPLDFVLDEMGVFRGFVMRRALGTPLEYSLFVPKRFSAQHPDWTRRESTQLAKEILKSIDYLHKMNVLLGDINPQNILFSGPESIHIVDCDSFQVEGYPCTVGTVNFSAPEIQGADFSKLIRTKEHELFAVATLLFMILLPGKPPYSHQGGEDGASNIREMNFPYTRDRNSSSRVAPQGVWTFCWSHLSTDLKDAFTRSFHRDYFGRQRVTIDEWLHYLDRYLRVLSIPENVFHGPKPQAGFDLGIMPHNPRYPPGTEDKIPRDGKSAYDRLLERMQRASIRLG